jgi:hypothetical protein
MVTVLVTTPHWVFEEVARYVSQRVLYFAMILPFPSWTLDLVSLKTGSC